MLPILPLCVVIIWTLMLRNPAHSWRTSFLISASLTVAWLILSTEILSFFHLFSFYPVLIIWLIPLVLLLGFVIPKQLKEFSLFPLRNDGLSLIEIVLLCLIATSVLMTVVTALISTPNTWDSMTYHLPRVEHWIQNKTIAYYPTHIIRQLYTPPGAEFIIAHLRILGAPESTANLVQWFAMAGSLLTVSLIAQELGASRRGQILSSLLLAALPIGLLQCVSTQTDLIGAFWLLNGALFLIKLRRDLNLLHLLGAGLNIGLAVLTKGTSYIFIIPFFIWTFTGLIKTQRLRSLLVVIGIFLCILLLNVGQYQRNINLFGSATWTDVPLTNASLDLGILWGNILRNTGLQLSTPWIDLNQSITQTLSSAAQLFHADIHDPRALLGANQFSIHSLSFDEDYGTNPLHVLVFFLMLICFLFARSKTKDLRFYLILILSAAILLCWTVRWQPWIGRFHLPLFILCCPLLGIFLDRFCKTGVLLTIAITFFLASLPWILLNTQHPWMGRSSIWATPKQSQYFYKKPMLEPVYANLIGQALSQQCHEIGLISGGDDWQYPIWSLLHQYKRNLRIEDIQVNNLSSSLKYPLGDFKPCLIINTDQPGVSHAR